MVASTRSKIIKTACVYVGIIFGAGFASGQEHLSFFLQYGLWGVFGVILAAFFLGLCGWAVMDICVRNKLGSYKDFMQTVFGAKLGGVLDIITGLFIFVVFSAMLAGTGALANETFGLPFSVGVFTAAILTFCVLLFDLRGMVEINTLISPILIIGSLLMGLYAIFNAYTPAFALSAHAAFWPASALVYAAYNLITAAAVLSSLPNLVTSRKIAKYGGILGGAALGIIGVILAAALFLNINAIRDAQLPMLALARNYGHVTEYAYAILLFLAIFTTSITGGFSLVHWLSARFGYKKLRIKIGIAIFGAAAAHAGFANIVANAYTFFGFLGLFMMLAVIIYFLCGFNKTCS